MLSVLQMVDAFEAQLVDEDEVVIEQGAEGQYIYIIDQGMFEIYISGKKIITQASGFAPFTISIFPDPVLPFYSPTPCFLFPDPVLLLFYSPTPYFLFL